ncbi:MAG: hypothetical protein ACYCW6_11110, partial [Candidatus Xenobia bacterium]
ASADLSGEAAFRDFIDHPPDSYCGASSRFRWTEPYSFKELTQLFHPSLPDLGEVQGLRVLSRSRAGRVQALEIDGSQVKHVVYKDAIRWLWSGGVIGTGGLQSTLFYVETLPDGVRLHGGGWGHGVGMCQEGAGGMAHLGIDHKAIIEHYYPGVSLSTLPSREGGMMPSKE